MPDQLVKAVEVALVVVEDSAVLAEGLVVPVELVVEVAMVVAEAEDSAELAGSGCW